SHPLSSIGNVISLLVRSNEGSKTQKIVKLSSGNYTDPSLTPPFSPGLELQGMSYRPALQSLDLHSQYSLNMPQFPRPSDIPDGAHPVSCVPVCTLSRDELLKSHSLLSHQLMGCCHQSRHNCTALGDDGQVTALYAELIRELERQMAELRTTLASREKAAALQDKRIQELELENQELKDQLRNLEEQNDFLSIRNVAEETASARVLLGTRHNSLDVNESDIQFLKGLVGMLENLAGAQVSGFYSPPSYEDQKQTSVTVSSNSPDWKTQNRVPSSLSPWRHAEDSSKSSIGLSDATCLCENNVQETLPDGTPFWASPVEENGRVKLELVPNSQVFITYHQLEDLSQVSTDKPELMTRRLLDYFFSRETLARSSATGQRIAHNNMTMEKPIPLPVAVVNAIKEYVTKTCGRSCNFNAVINSKCGTSRRAVKKMIIHDSKNELNITTSRTCQEPLKG
ncbi:hypothetical protein lerEdw1_001448, partial [Lerista edwardsae]